MLNGKSNVTGSASSIVVRSFVVKCLKYNVNKNYKIVLDNRLSGNLEVKLKN